MTPENHDETAHLLNSPRNAERLRRSIQHAAGDSSDIPSVPIGGQPFEDFLVELAKRNDVGVLKRIPTYLDVHLTEFCGDRSSEINRLVVAFRDKAPDNVLSPQMLKLISEKLR